MRTPAALVLKHNVAFADVSFAVGQKRRPASNDTPPERDCSAVAGDRKPTSSPKWPLPTRDRSSARVVLARLVAMRLVLIMQELTGGRSPAGVSQRSSSFTFRECRRRSALRRWRGGPGR